MSYATGTTHYNLPITVGSDKRDWGDTNQAFQNVDAALYQASEDATSAGSGVTALDTQINGVGGIDARLTQAEHDIDDVEGDVSTLQGTVSGHTTQIADVRQDAEDMIVAVEITAAQMEDAPVALTVGKYFRYNDVLYRVTVDIAVHDVIVPNTNCVATNVATELETLNTGLGQAVTASDVSYDNTGSGLTADDVQEAIDEIKSALPKYKLVASGTSQTSNASQLTELETAFNALSDIEKMSAILKDGNGVNHIFNLAGTFTAHYNDGTGTHGTTYSLTNHTKMYDTTDQSSTINNNSLVLYVLK